MKLLKSYMDKYKRKSSNFRDFEDLFKELFKEQLFEDLLDKFEDKIYAFIEKYSFDKSLEKLEENPSNLDFIILNSDITSKFLQFAETDSDVEKFFSILTLYPEKIIEMNPLMDKRIYFEFKKICNKASEKNSAKFKKVRDSYFKSISSKISRKEIINSLLIFRERYQGESNSTDKFLETRDKLFSDFIENLNEFDYRTYFFDWVLKFGYLIEGPIKEFLKTLLKLDYIIRNYSDERIENIDRDYYFSDIINELKEDKLLNDYRNAIFHSNFTLEFSVNLEEKSIIFKKNNRIVKKLNINEFIGYFYGLIQLIYLFDFSLIFHNEYIKPAILYEMGYYEYALKELENLPIEKYIDKEIYLLKSVILCNLQRFEDALKAINEQFAIEPARSYYYGIKCGILCELKKFKEALKINEEAIKLQPQEMDNFEIKVYILYKSNKFEEALKIFDEKIVINSEILNYYYFEFKAKILLKLKKYQESLDSIIKAIDYNNSEIDYFLIEAVTLAKLEQKYDAYQVMKRLIKALPDYVKNYYILGMIHMEFNKYIRAIKSFKKGLKTDKEEYYQHKFFIMMGKCYVELGKSDLAKKYLELGKKKAIKQKNYKWTKKANNLITELKNF